MSLAIAFKGPEGIVLAADSRVTLTAQLQGGEGTLLLDNSRPWHNDEHGIKLTVMSENISSAMSLQPIPLQLIFTRYSHEEIASKSILGQHQSVLPLFEEQTIPASLQAEFDAWDMLSDEVFMQFEQELR